VSGLALHCLAALVAAGGAFWVLVAWMILDERAGMGGGDDAWPSR